MSRNLCLLWFGLLCFGCLWICISHAIECTKPGVWECLFRRQYRKIISSRYGLCRKNYSSLLCVFRLFNILLSCENGWASDTNYTQVGWMNECGRSLRLTWMFNLKIQNKHHVNNISYLCLLTDKGKNRLVKPNAERFWL